MGEFDSHAFAVRMEANNGVRMYFAFRQGEEQLEVRSHGKGVGVAMKTPPRLRSCTRETVRGPVEYHATQTPVGTESRGARRLSRVRLRCMISWLDST